MLLEIRLQNHPTNGIQTRFVLIRPIDLQIMEAVRASKYTHPIVRKPLGPHSRGGVKGGGKTKNRRKKNVRCYYETNA